MNEFDAIEERMDAYASKLVADPEARYEALRGCSFFTPVADQGLRQMAGMVDIQVFNSDVCLTTQDDESQAFYVILYGMAEVFRNGRRIGEIGTGECIGEAIFFADAGNATSATVIAEYRIIAAVFSKEAVARLQADAGIRESMDRALLLSLYGKLKGANKKIEELLLRQSMRD